jgi:hypothetical protein
MNCPYLDLSVILPIFRSRKSEMNNRKQRAEIAKETLEILERGNYQNRSG